MNRFSSLLKYSAAKDPAAAQKKARSGFRRAVLQSEFTLRMPSAPLGKTGRHFIIGVAIYAADELRLLDELESSLPANGRGSPTIEVFDVLQCQQMQDFEEFVPGIGNVSRTPVIGVLIDGTLVDKATGLSDVRNALRRFNLLEHRISV